MSAFSITTRPGERESRRVQWIVCGHVTRDVHAMRVQCPQRGDVAVSRCLDCHLLETLEGESARQGCATPDD
jgi:predicted RNA-binding Zn-ribbon protein involved in translation (DUF1610 family)